MLRRMQRRIHACRQLALAGCLLAGCRDRGGAPTLDGIDDQLAAVGQELVVELHASDPDGDAIAFDFDTEQASINSDGSITRRPDGTGVFSWTPLGEDLGTWYVDFSASDGDHEDVVTVTIEVRSTLGQGAVPSFREPLGSGTTLDLEQAACVELPVVVEDQDDTEVVLAIGGTGPDGATLTQTGGLSGMFAWCPSHEQVADERHPVVLSADDDEHDPSLKNYLVVLRKAPKPDCPGEAPTIVHEPADLESVLAIDIAARITDDVGLKQAPLLYWTYTEPGDPVDFGKLDVVEMTLE
ncbi:MAG: hypothetical protein IAG13_39280, partial [Deltaproteobacteria bacterium]|nr:hypothetical protein [Nannocystaceae bacterium]